MNNAPCVYMYAQERAPVHRSIGYVPICGTHTCVDIIHMVTLSPYGEPVGTHTHTHTHFLTLLRQISIYDKFAVPQIIEDGREITRVSVNEIRSVFILRTNVQKKCSA